MIEPVISLESCFHIELCRLKSHALVTGCSLLTSFKALSCWLHFSDQEAVHLLYRLSLCLCNSHSAHAAF